MSVVHDIPITQILTQLRAAGLRATTPRIAVLQTLQSAPDRWLCTESLYRELLAGGAGASLGTLYRTLNEMVSCGLLLRETDEIGRRHFRFHSGSGPALHRLVCNGTGQVIAFADDALRDRLASVIRSHGLMLTDEPITVQAQCVKVEI